MEKYDDGMRWIILRVSDDLMTVLQRLCQPHDGGHLQELPHLHKQHSDARHQDVQRRAKVGPRAAGLLLRRDRGAAGAGTGGHQGLHPASHQLTRAQD